MIAPEALDQTDLDTFTARMLDVLNHAALAVMCSIGHQTGLFDAMANLPPCRARQIAALAELDARYVREWLAAMTTGRIVRYDPESERYWLPAEHAALLTRAAGPENFAFQAQYIALLGHVEQPIVRCFLEGGGVGRERFFDLQSLIAEESGTLQDRFLLETTLPLVDDLVSRLESGIDVLELGCGSGHAINLMSRAFPASRFVGVDRSAEAIEAGRREAQDWGLDNASFEVRERTILPEQGAYDFIYAFRSLHDQPDPVSVLTSIRSAMRASGRFLLVENASHGALHENLNHPLAPFMYTRSCMHSVAVSLSEDGAGLGEMWGERLTRDLLREAGFGRLDVRRTDADIINNYYVVGTR